MIAQLHTDEKEISKIECSMTTTAHGHIQYKSENHCHDLRVLLGWTEDGPTGS